MPAVLQRTSRDTGPSAEQSFLCAVVRAFLAGSAPPPPPEHLDWKRVSWLLMHYNLAPIFRHTIGQEHGVPPEYIRVWDAFAIRAMVENTRATRAAVHLFRILEEVQLPAAAMRGLPLSHTVYADPALRPMRDIDVLIPSAALEPFLDAMHAHGFDARRRLRSQVVYQVDATIFEIHWRFLTPRRYQAAADFEQWLDRRREIRTAQGPFYCLAPEDEFLGVVMHAFVHHELDRLMPLVDVACMMREPLDWEYIARWCRDARVTRVFEFVLSFAEHLFGGGEMKALETLRGKLPAPSQRTYRAYEVALFEDDRLWPYLRRKRHLLSVAEGAARKSKQLMRFVTMKEVRRLMQLLVRRRLTRQGQHEDRTTLDGYDGPRS